MFKPIDRVEFFTTKFNRRGEGSVWLHLSCGHTETRKQSKFRAGQVKAYCRGCTHAFEEQERKLKEIRGKV